MKAFCEILRIITYFYMVIYAMYTGLDLIHDADLGCIDGKVPIAEVLIALEGGIFAFWILSTPIFIILSNGLGYDSIEEQRVHAGLTNDVYREESKWRLDFLDYSKQDLQPFNISCLNFLMTLACLIVVPATGDGGYIYNPEAE